MARDILSWDDLQGSSVYLAKDKRLAGTIEDFYYENETHTVYALRVKVPLHGYAILQPRWIQSIDESGVTIDNEQMLVNESNASGVTHFPRGSQLIGYKVRSESGRDLGTVRGIWLAIRPVLALRIYAFSLGSQNTPTLPAREVTLFGNGELFVIEQEAKKFH